MKKILALFLALLLCLNLCSCSTSTVEVEVEMPSSNTSMFIKIETFRTPDCEKAYVFYHKETKVMYVISSDGIATVMLNLDGTPQVYQE